MSLVMGTGFFLLGAHRSGMSAVSRGLLALGVRLGERPVPGGKGTPKEDGENRFITVFNEKLLNSLGLRWDSLRAIDPLEFEQPEVKRLRQEAFDLVVRLFDGCPAWGFEDPRTARLLSFWQPLFIALGVEDRYVIALRDPLSVCQSLKGSDGFSMERSCLLWLQHMLPAISHTEGKRRIVVEYNRLLENPFGQLERIACTLGLPLAAESERGIRLFTDELIDKRTKHGTFGVNLIQAEPRVLDIVVRTYELLGLCASDQISLEDEVFRTAWRGFEDESLRLAPIHRFFDQGTTLCRGEVSNLLGKLKSAHECEFEALLRLDNPDRDQFPREFGNLQAELHATGERINRSTQAGGVGGLDPGLAAESSAALPGKVRCIGEELTKARYHALELENATRQLEAQEGVISALRWEVRQKEGELAEARSRAAALAFAQLEMNRLRSIEDSAAWKLIRRMLDILDYRILPHSSRRSRLLRPLLDRLVSAYVNRRGEEPLPLLLSSTRRLSEGIQHFEARAGTEKRKIRKISFLTTHWDEQSQRYRVYNLIEGLVQRGIECCVFHEANADRIDLFLDSGLLVIFRVAISGTVRRIIARMREQSIPVVFDIDDLIFEPSCVQYFDGLHNMALDKRRAFVDSVVRWRETLLLSDYVTCTTDLLATFAQNLGKKTFVIKNTVNERQVDLAEELLKDRRGNREGERVRIGYFSGSLTHNKDFRDVSAALLLTMKKFPNTEFHVVGQLDLDPVFDVFGSRVIRQSLLPHLQYLEYKSHMDINLAPLERENPFTGCKSELKIFEAALLEIPTIASPVDSYRRCITDGVDGFLAATPDDWVEKLALLIEHPEVRERVGKQARESFLARYHIKNVIDDVIGVYEGIADHCRVAGRAQRRSFNLPVVLPRFSIVSVLYRKEEQVRLFLRTIVTQSYCGPVEIVLIDDRSPDHSYDVVREFIAEEGREWLAHNQHDIRIIRNDTNIGNCASRNRGIREATGDIIVVIDADCLLNRDYLSAHAEAYSTGQCDVAVGPLNIETGDRDPWEVLEHYEGDLAQVKRDALPQDPINPRSFLNCITRNFSIHRPFIEGDLFDVRFSYSEKEDSGFGWEDVEMGYRLYQRGARIKVVPDSFSVHVSHPSIVDESTKPLRSLKNFRLLFEKHPDLLLVARRWTLETYERICDWLEKCGHEKNDDRSYLDNFFNRFLPAPFRIRTHHRLRVLTHRWHCAHQYELYKLQHDFTLVTGLGTNIAEYWEYTKRPLPQNAAFRHAKEVDFKDFDLAVLHFDENILAPENTNGIIGADWKWGETAKWFRKNVSIPMVAICHGTPQFHGQYDMNYNKPDLLEVVEDERKRLVEFMGDTLVVVNSYQAEREWGFHKSKVIWHGFDPTEFLMSTYERGILTMSEKALRHRPHYNGYFTFRKVFDRFPPDHAPAALVGQEPVGVCGENTNEFAEASFREYVDEVRRYSIYFNPTLRSPMPRSRAEAMMCGLAIVTMNNHDVELFMKHGVDGFYSNNPDELREYLMYLVKKPGVAESIGTAGRLVAMDIFNHDRYLHTWQETINDLLGVRA